MYPNLLWNHAILDILNPPGGKVMLLELSPCKKQLKTNILVVPAVKICSSGCCPSK
jgi:hypothetical protein